MGSSPTRVDFVFIASMAQWIARRTSNPKVAGSNPAGGGHFLFLVVIVTVYINTLVFY